MRDAAHSPDDTVTAIETDATLHAIRSVLTQETPVPSQPVSRQKSVVDQLVGDPRMSHVTTPPTHKTRTLPTLAEGLKARVLSYRPTRKHVGVAALCVVLVLRPHWFVIAAFVTLFLTLGAFLCFGADRVWGTSLRVFQRYSARYPQRAARLSSKLDTFAMRWDAFLDRFPEGSVEGLYLPDFQALQARDEAHANAVDARLARMQAEG